MKPIPGYDGYFATECGQIFSAKSNSFLKHNFHNFGYPVVCLYIGGKGKYKTKSVAVHRLVLLAYRGESHGLVCAHLDGNPKNNNLSNLKWVTQKENLGHMVKHGTSARGEKNGNSKFTLEDVISIRASFRSDGKKRTNIKLLAEKYQTNIERIRRIVRGLDWAWFQDHITPSGMPRLD